MPRAIELYEEDFLKHQWEFINSYAKTLGLVGGLGSGKTITFLYKTLICHLTRPGANGLSRIGILYPTFRMNKSLFFEPFVALLHEAGITHSKSVTTLDIETDYGRIINFSMQNPKRIIAETLTDAGADEIDTVPMPKGMDTISKLRARLRGRKDAHLYMVTSPEGYLTSYEVLHLNPAPNTHLIKAKTTDNKFLYHQVTDADGNTRMVSEYIDNLLATYDTALINAYINGEFTNLNSMCAHYAFKRDKHVHDVDMPDPNETVYAGIDFNVNPLCAAMCYIRLIDGVKHFYFYDEYYLKNSNTYILADILAGQYENRHLICYPDPTGDSRKTSADHTDLDILSRKGFDVRARHGITQRASLNFANGAFDHDRIHVSPKCKWLIKDLEQVTTDQYGQIEKPKGTMLTHISDGMRNIITMETLRDIPNKSEAGGL